MIGQKVLSRHHNDKIGTLGLSLRTTSKRWCQRKSFQQFSYSAFLLSTELEQSYKLTITPIQVFRIHKSLLKRSACSEFSLLKFSEGSVCFLGTLFWTSEVFVPQQSMAWKSLLFRIVAIVMAVSVGGATPVESEQQGIYLLPWTKKKNHHQDSLREERCSTCDIMLDQARSAQGKSRGQSRIGLALRWSRMISHVEQRSSRRESRWWFFFFVQGRTIMFATFLLMCLKWEPRFPIKEAIKPGAARNKENRDEHSSPFLRQR